MSNVQDLRRALERAKGSKIEVEESIKELRVKFKESNASLHKHEQAKEIIRDVGQKTQEQLKFHISDMVTLALDAVFSDPYQLKVDFVKRRNKMECDLMFVRDGCELDPIDSAGVGAVDVASFALRIASWSMQLPHSSNTIILDEPFKHLRGEIENERVLEMLTTISKMLNLQIIMVGDIKVPKETMLEYADKVFECKIKDRVSKVVAL